jgi:hypothetical protein
LIQSALSYSFPLDNKYNYYTVIQNEEALQEKMDFTLTKKNEIYSIDGHKELKREELTDAILKKIDDAKSQIYRETFRIKLESLY